MDNTVRAPHIVLVLTDDQGCGDLGRAGNPVLQTPNLDRFAGNSVRFVDYHVGPTCAPTRAGLFTGRYANSTGVWHTVGGRSLLRKDEWTIAAAFREQGYRTGLFGKWHLGDVYPYRPQDRGFDTTVVHGGGGISQVPDYWGNDYFDDTYMADGRPRAFEGYCTDVFFEQAMAFIEAEPDRPCLCVITTNAPHCPYNVEEKYARPYRGQVPEERARFYGMIANIDWNFGRLQDRLKATGLEENTILMFMTDNGTAAGAAMDKEGFVTEGYNAGLRGIKNTPYDGGHRVPFFLRWPAGKLDRGMDVDRLTSHIDFMPTLLDLCEIPAPPSRSFHGRSLKPLLYGDRESWPERAIVTDSQRVTMPIKWRQSAVMTERWRLINGEALYDMTEDRGQTRDIASRHPDVVATLRAEYETWWGIVSTQFDEDIPFTIGDEAHPAIELTCHDWRNEAAWVPHQQGEIRKGIVGAGYWEIDVARAGKYVFELRRWPSEADRAIRAGIEGDDVPWKKEWIGAPDWYYYTGGSAQPIREAGLRIGGREFIAAVQGDQKAARFTVSLEAGPTRLEAWFAGDGGLEMGAYYVHVISMTRS